MQEKHLKRLVDNLPPEGSVRCLTVTEKQFASMKLLVGLPLFQEKKVQGQPNAAVLNGIFTKKFPPSLRWAGICVRPIVGYPG